MKLLITYGPDKIFEGEADLSAFQISHIQKQFTWMIKTPAEKASFLDQLKTDWLAKLPEEERAAVLAVAALPENERKLEYVKQQQTYLQTQLAKVEANVTAMTSEIEAKAVVEKPIGTPLIKP